MSIKEKRPIDVILESSMERLSYAIPKVVNRIGTFTVGSYRSLSDLCFTGYLLHFKDNIAASEILLRNESTGYAAFANVRASFEAIEDALFLANQNGDEREKIAAQIRVFERFELADSKAKFVEATPEMNHGLTREELYKKTEASILKDIANMTEKAPSSAALLQIALSEQLARFRKPKYKLPSEWLPRSKRRTDLVSKLQTYGYSSDLMSTYYSDLSRFAHPRFRMDSYSFERKPSVKSIGAITEIRMRAAEVAIFSIHFMWISMNLYERRQPLFRINSLTPKI